MICPDEVIAGWYYLSSIDSPEQAHEEYEQLQKKFSAIPQSYQSFYSWYLDYYKNYEQFPAWESFKATSGVENDCALSSFEAQKLYKKTLSVWECDSLCDRMKDVPLTDKRTLLDSMARVLQSDVTEEKPIMEASAFNPEGSMIQVETAEVSKFRFPIKHLNTNTKIRPGNAVYIFAPPAMAKTSFAENIVYINSVTGTLVGLYIFLENLPAAYMADIYARFSFDQGTKIENSSLKQGVPVEDTSAVEAIKKLKSEFDTKKLGKFYFKPFSDYSTDPMVFGTQLANDVNRLHVDYIVFDYIQRAKVFAPLRVDVTTYLNQLASTCAQVALGGFGALHPSIFIGLAQPNREAQNKAERTHGNSFNRTSVAEVSAVERDAFVMIALYADAEAKASGQIGYKICKNRDGPEDISMLTTSFIPQQCYIGDIVEGTDTDVYNADVLDDVFDLDI